MPKAARKKTKNVRVKLKTRSKRISKSVYRVCAIMGLLAVAVGFFGAYTLYSRINQAFVSAASPTGYAFSSDLYPAITYAVLDDVNADFPTITKLNFILVDKNAKKLLVYKVPVSLAVDVPGKFGVEPLAKVYSLGNIASDQGIDVVTTTLFKLFGYKPSKYIVVDERLQNQVDTLFRTGSLLQFLDRDILSNLKSTVKTDLALSEISGIAGFVSSLPEERVIFKDFTYAYVENPSSIDEEILEVTAYSDVAQEGKAISVLNGTEASGIAGFGDRVIRNMGGRVVNIANSGEPFSETILIVDDPSSQTAAFMSRVFHIQKVIAKSDALGFREAEIARSDITIILGFDFSANF